MIINRYNESGLKQLLKREARFLAKYVYFFLGNGFRHRNALFYPEYPDRRAAVCRVMDALGFNIINNPKKRFEIVFYWKDATFREGEPLLDELAREHAVINLQCRDISKKRVESAFREVFGYGTFVDPTRHQGKCVRKSDLNAQHDGAVIDCPIQGDPDSEYIYQKLLNHVNDEQLAVDYRVAVVGREIAYFKLRFKRLEDRFAHTIRESVIEVGKYLSAAEENLIIRFCEKIGMDYGELDMIRDQADGKLYIVDANSTPFRPPPDFNVPPEERKRMDSRSAAAFRRTYIR